MKKTFLLLLICSALCILTACNVLVDKSEEESETSKQLAESYGFYSDSIEVLKEDMELDTEKANAVFQTLVTVGLDEKITYCFDEDEFYKVWWGLTSVDVYLSDNVVEKIFDGDNQLYPTPENDLHVPDEIIWDDDENIGIVNLELDGNHTKEVIIANYYNGIARYLKNLDKDKLKDYEYIQFRGNVVREEKIECTLLGNLSIDYIRNTESFLSGYIESNMTDIFIPKPLR